MPSHASPFHWHPDSVSIAQFASRVREACTGVGHITVVAVGYEYGARDGTLYRVTHGNWQPIGDALEIIALPDEALFTHCR